MNVTEPGLRIIKHWEQGPHGGPALKAYLCSAAVPTIGYGHTRGVKMGDTCDIEQANQWLKDDCRDAELAVHKLVNAPLNQNQFDALVSFVFNIGEGQFSDSTLLRLLNEGDYSGAANQFTRWNKAKGAVLNGLIARRAQERHLFLRTQ